MKAFIAFFIKVLPALAQFLGAQHRVAQSQADKQDGYDHGELEAHQERDRLDVAKRNADVNSVPDSAIYQKPVRRKPKNSPADKTDNL